MILRAEEKARNVLRKIRARDWFRAVEGKIYDEVQGRGRERVAHGKTAARTFHKCFVKLCKSSVRKDRHAHKCYQI